MAEGPKCQKCEELKKASHEASRSFHTCRPMMHTGHTPKSRWLQSHKSVRGDLERAYHLADAEYQLHVATTHTEGSVSRTELERLWSIIIRKGRLETLVDSDEDVNETGVQLTEYISIHLFPLEAKGILFFHAQPVSWNSLEGLVADRRRRRKPR